ncbi:ABC transporter permease subunit [bacterium]|nr:ABC transporter permease subunit [bacterium]
MPTLLRATLLLLLLTLAGCERPGQIRVGSKSFTESVILGEVIQRHLSSHSISSQHRSQLGGTRVLWEALLAGSIDVYPEYTGTLAQEILHQPGLEGEALRTRLAEQGIGMTESLGFSNTYALAMRADRASQLNLSKISQLKSHPDLQLGFGHEFLQRQDGWLRVQQRYALPQTKVVGTDHDLGYAALVAGQLDVMDAYATDAEIAHHQLFLLEDDLEVFPRYDAVILYRLQSQNQLGIPLKQLEGRLDREQMTKLNEKVRLGGQSESEVASAWLGASTPHQPGLGERLLKTTGAHFRLVATSVSLACLLGLPLGMLCHSRPFLGQAVLPMVSSIQTIPSLALLVFLLPWGGLGTGTAMTALTLYALLPIVQGTYLGLQTIPTSLQESARALGISPRCRWTRIDLPLALPNIVSGIQTAAVIAVGTATLAALIGAGGYGEPILTGVRLARTDLLLEGAIPSACMALLVQWFFTRWQSRLKYRS